MVSVVESTSTQYVQTFSETEKNLPGRALPWLAELRRDAIHGFAELGFPTAKQEAWRFTPVDGIAKTAFYLPGRSPLSREALQRVAFKGLDAFQLVFVNSQFSSELSTKPIDSKVVGGSLAAFLGSHAKDLEAHLGRHADARQHPFTALNTALFSDGAHVYVPKDAVVETPIHILYIATPAGAPAQMHPRSLIVLGENAQATIIEHWVGVKNDSYFTNAVTEIVLGENSRLTHYKIQQESTAAFHISTTQVAQKRSSRYHSHAILLGGAVARNNLNVTLGEEGAECSLNGLYVAGGRQIIDSHTWIDHSAPHTQSREYYKGILDEKAQAVFDGHIIVRPVAQKTDSAQTNKNLLLSNEARVNTKPELKIFANDVKCKHGATIGQINADQLFYLRTRGLPKDEARQLLIYAFASEMIEAIETPALRDALRAVLLSKFQG